MKEDLFTKEELQELAPVFKSKRGSALLDRLVHFVALDRLNAGYRESSIYEGVDCAHELLKIFETEYKVGGLDLDKLPEGAFITISNHPYGGVDGLVLMDLIGHYRPKLKVMVNKILGMAKKLGPNIITVTPTGESRKSASKESINGIKESIEVIRSGGVLGLFPSGAVSDLKPSEGFKIRDREWQMAAIKLIKKLNVPVVPIRFFDRNNIFYYLLGLISWKVRLLRLPREIMNKKGKNVRIGIGEIIPAEKIQSFETLEELRTFLRNSVYGMKPPKKYIKSSELPFNK